MFPLPHKLLFHTYVIGHPRPDLREMNESPILDAHGKSRDTAHLVAACVACRRHPERLLV